MPSLLPIAPRRLATTPLTLKELAVVTGATLIGDPTLVIRGARAPADAVAGDLTFVASAAQRRALRTTGASVVLLAMSEAAEHAHELPCAVLCHDDPHIALVDALNALFQTPKPTSGIDHRTVLHPETELGDDVTVGPFSVIGASRVGDRTSIGPFVYIDDDVDIANDVVIGAHAVLLRGTVVGARTQLQPGVVLGADGFGYAAQGTSNVKVPQVGGVVVGEDVEFGANTCVDRGGLSDTNIGRGTKVDNLVQIGHGVTVGEDVVLIAQVGIGGDTRVGDRALLAGQVGVAHHLDIGDDARVGAQGGVTRNVPAAAAVSGYPALAHGDWLRAMVRVRHLDGMAKRLEAAEAAVETLRAEVLALKGERP